MVWAQLFPHFSKTDILLDAKQLIESAECNLSVIQDMRNKLYSSIRDDINSLGLQESDQANVQLVELTHVKDNVNLIRIVDATRAGSYLMASVIVPIYFLCRQARQPGMDGGFFKTLVGSLMAGGLVGAFCGWRAATQIKQKIECVEKLIEKANSITQKKPALSL